MKEQDRIWILMSRKLAGEATEKEIKELEEWQRQHPEISYSFQVLTDLWNTRSPQERDMAEGTTTEGNEKAEEAFESHLLRLEAQTPSSQPPPPPYIWGNNIRRRPFEEGRARLGNYIRTTWRSVSRNKKFSAINIAGLATGIASAVLLLLWIHNEVSADRFHKNSDRIYQAFSRNVVDGRVEVWGSTPMPMGPELQKVFPRQVESVVRMNWVGAFILSVADQHLQKFGFLTDPAFLTMFSFPLVKGNASTALNNVHSIVLTEKLAKELFGDQEPMGQNVRIDSNVLFKVTGVMKDLPPNTAFDFDYLVPWSYNREVGWEEKNWGSAHIQTFVLLRPGITEEMANTNFRDLIRAHAPGVNSRVFLHPIRKWRLYSEFENGKIVGGEINFLRLVGVIAAFILLIACINYMNLSTARSMRRARDVAIRKLVGAGRSSLVKKFLGESVLVAALSGGIALLMAQLALPVFDHFVEKDLAIPYAEPGFWLLAVGFILFIGVVAGSYPAFYLSAFRPINVIKGYFKGVAALIAPRKILVIVQFTIAIGFIICTLVIYRQIEFIRHRDIGYRQDNLVFTYMKGLMGKKYEAIRDDLIGSGVATEVIRTNSPITDIWSSNNDYEWKGKEPNTRAAFVEVYSDHALVSTLGLKLIAGREIDIRRYPEDSSALVLTESAVKRMGFEHPIGQKIKNIGKEWHVVGVAGDFIIGSPFYQTSPIIIKGPVWEPDNTWFGTITCKLNPRNVTTDNIEKMTAIFKKYNPDYPFSYNFVNRYYAEKFFGQQREGLLAAYFAGLSIVISCLGLFGLAAYMAESRIKEVGIRKVLGGSVLRISVLLSKDFLLLVFIAFCIASPIAGAAMNYWLRDYPYRISISWWLFPLAGIFIGLLAAGTVGWQALKAALMNPVGSLRTD